jgi:hypothetical protein
VAFAHSHAEYLAQELEQERQDLEGARAAAPLGSALQLCRSEQEELGREFRRLESAIGHPAELRDIAKRIRAIGSAAAQARQGL